MPTVENAAVALDVKTTAEVGEAGAGFDSLRGAKRKSPLQSQSYKTGDYADVRLTFDQFTTRSEFLHKLRVSGSANFDGYGFSADLTAEFASTTQIEEGRTYVFADMRVLTTRDVLDQDAKAFSDEAKTHLGSPRDFFSFYGNEYVDEVRYGGRLILVMQAFTRTVKQTKDVSVAVAAANATFQGSGDYAESIRQLKTVETLSVRARICGLKPGAAVDATNAVALVQSFPSLVQRRAFVVEYVRHPLTTVPSTPPAPSAVDAVQLRNEIVSRIEAVEERLAACEDVLRYPFRYAGADPVGMATMRKGLSDLRAEYRLLAEKFLLDPLAKLDVPPFNPAGNVTPAPLADYRVPLKIVAQGQPGDGSGWVGKPNNALNSITVELATDAFGAAGLSVQYKRSVLTGNAPPPLAGFAASVSDNWADASVNSPANNVILALAFRLVGELSDKFEIHYEAKLLNGSNFTGETQDGNWIGMAKPLFGDYNPISLVRVRIVEK